MKFGIVGTNFVSDFFMEALKDTKGASCVAVAGTSYQKAKAFADKYGIPNAYGSYKEMLDDKVIDAGYLAVPNSIHREVSNCFINQGIPSLCEKPLASNYREAKEMIELAKQKNVYLAHGIIPLYTPNFKLLKDNLSKLGVLRRANLVFSKYSSRYDAYLKGENPTTFRSELSNGALMDLGIYPLAVTIGLFGKPLDIMAKGMILPTGVDALGTAILVYKDFQVDIAYSKVTDTIHITEFEGESGNIYVDGISQLPNVWFVDRKTKNKEELSIKQLAPMSYEIQDFIDVVSEAKKESEVVPYQLSLDIMEVATEIRKRMGVVFPADK